MLTPRRGRPPKYAEFDALVADLPDVMEKRPKYVRGIGVFRGSRETTAWLKIRLPNGGTLRGKSYPPDASVEVKVRDLASWDWERDRQASGATRPCRSRGTTRGHARCDLRSGGGGVAYTG